MNFYSLPINKTSLGRAPPCTFTPKNSTIGPSNLGSLVRSEWCTNAIQKLATFASSVLRENAQLRQEPWDVRKSWGNKFHLW